MYAIYGFKYIYLIKCFIMYIKGCINIFRIVLILVDKNENESKCVMFFKSRVDKYIRCIFIMDVV